MSEIPVIPELFATYYQNAADIVEASKQKNKPENHGART